MRALRAQGRIKPAPSAFNGDCIGHTEWLNKARWRAAFDREQSIMNLKIFLRSGIWMSNFSEFPGRF
ncbi:hypothetical protein Q4610_02670 [Sphingobium sp. HBC34]|uniref:Transposase DDE domain-containing protein n=1 Tax=Sphingobium cyanobacteriorum TaxID=3063954 RepID=A0ABT8ZHB6_9SPHN|nr:hypothetical protein [Sphingobium sp. HBC34]MDO7833939.1 hypothetical protein [Sphingobium sp. HBC34]